MKPGSIPWTDADNAMLRELYTTKMPMPEIVARIGHPINAVYKQAMHFGLRRPAGKGSKLGPKKVLALTLAARPEGVGVADLTGIDPVKAGTMLYRLCCAAMLHRGILGRRTVRFFTSKTHRDKWVADNLPAHLAKAAMYEGKKAASPTRWPADAPMVITPQTKFTYAPPPPAMVYRTNTYA